MEKTPKTQFVSPEETGSGKDALSNTETDGYNLQGADYDNFVANFKARRKEKDARWENEEPVENKRARLHRRIGRAIVGKFERQSEERATSEKDTTVNDTLGDIFDDQNPDTPDEATSPPRAGGDRYYQYSATADRVDGAAARVSDWLDSRALKNQQAEAIKMDKARDRKAAKAERVEAKAKARAERRETAKLEREARKAERRKRLHIGRAALSASIEAARSTYKTTKSELGDDAKTI